MILPQELVDKILVHLRNDNKALRNCSLVAKSWTYPSQKLLYTNFVISPIKYGTWQEIASPTIAELLQHVYSLHCLWFNSLYDFHEDHLKSFHRLQELYLYYGSFKSDAANFFPAFQNTLSSLFLINFVFTLDAFIKLVCYFPNLRVLHLRAPAFGTEHLTTPPPSSTPIRGTLSLCLFSLGSVDTLLRALLELELEYEELEVVHATGNPSHVRSFISRCEKTLKRLKLGPKDCKLQKLHNNTASIA